ncbi:hypothetical protein ABS858_02310 [Vibrio neptunius]|uniref:hypothetical protein n=1 Tax=Vibrio neptunius TaxID=170651 RepID=UPI0033146714
MKKRFLMLTALASFSASAVEWVGPFNTGIIEIHESGVFFIQPTPIATNIPCKAYTFVKFSSEKSKLADRALSVGLSAAMAGKKVKFQLSHCDDKYLVADSIMLPQ